jgi:hypothetical protein
MILTVKENKYGVPVGNYVAKFVGVETNTHPEHGEGLEWIFEVTKGPHAGAKTSRTTGTVPSGKNACGRILGGITGGAISPGVEVNLAHYVGKKFLVMVENNSTNTGTRLGTVMPNPDEEGAPAVVSRVAAPPTDAPPPPPRRSNKPNLPVNTATDLNAMITVDIGNDQPSVMTVTEVRGLIESGKLLAADIYVLQGNSWVAWSETAGGLPF